MATSGDVNKIIPGPIYKEIERNNFQNLSERINRIENALQGKLTDYNLNITTGGVVPTSRTISTSNGLSGGGTLASDLTLSPTYGTTANTVCQGNDVRLNSELVYDSGYIAGAATTFGYASLDGATDGGYDFELIVVNASGSSINYDMFVNNDTTATNYQRGGTYSGAAWGNENVNDAQIDYFGTGQTRIFYGRLTYTTAGYVISNYNGYGTDNFVLNHGWRHKTTVANFTRLDVTARSANGLGAGSRLRIWKKI